MNKSTFEEQLSKNGKLIYTNKGDSMMPLIKQDRDSSLVLELFKAISDCLFVDIEQPCEFFSCTFIGNWNEYLRLVNRYTAD